jgi:hypothetical protein
MQQKYNCAGQTPVFRSLFVHSLWCRVTRGLGGLASAKLNTTRLSPGGLHSTYRWPRRCGWTSRCVRSRDDGQPRRPPGIPKPDLEDYNSSGQQENRRVSGVCSVQRSASASCKPACTICFERLVNRRIVAWISITTSLFTFSQWR